MQDDIRDDIQLLQLLSINTVGLFLINIGVVTDRMGGNPINDRLSSR